MGSVSLGIVSPVVTRMLLVARTDVNSRPESSGQGSGVEPIPIALEGPKVVWSVWAMDNFFFILNQCTSSRRKKTGEGRQQRFVVKDVPLMYLRDFT